MKPGAIHSFLAGTLRGRLILSVALIHAVMMTFFVIDLTVRQRSMILDRQTEDATGLAHALSTSAAGWLAADDIAGLQELVEAQSRYPELIFAILADKEGRILAHTDKSKNGQAVLDLPADARLTVLSKSALMVDVAIPAMLGGRHVGWARVGIGQKAAGKKLAEITVSGVLYACAAILFGSFIAWLMGSRITSRLYAVQETINRVRTGDHAARSQVSGIDEAAQLAGEFNALLDALAERAAELNLANDSLRKSHEAYQCILATTSDGFWHVDTTGRLLNVNASYAGQSGYSIEELLALQITDLETNESLAETAEHMKRVISAGSDLFETRHRRKDGSVWDVEISCSYLDVEGGQILAFLRDISERKQAEEALHESTEKFSVAFNNAPIIITISYFEDGTYLDVNQQFLTVSGFSREEVIGRTSVALGWISAADRENLKEMMLERGKIHEQDITLHTKSGKAVLCKYWCEIITVAGQQRLLFIALDITEHRRIEQQFLQAQKLESVGRLAGGVAHDFNNMLGVIIGHAELALMHADSSNPLRQDLEAILEAANRSADITRQLLAFARQQSSIPKVQDLNETVFGMLKMLRRMIGEDIELSWKPGYELWRVKIDPTQLDQILANLCVNARDAIAGVGAIEIRTENIVIEESEYGGHEELAPGEYVLLSVSDNGSGMGKDIIEHIFEPFYTTKELGHGTGLGLATVFGIVKQNGGHIKVYSEPGHGTVFRMYLHAEKSAVETSTIKKQPITGGDETILIVEDELAILSLATNMLAKLGYRVLPANSTEDAQRLAAEHQGKINLLVTDIIMPGMNGRDLAELLHKSNPDMKCLFMSGYTADVMSERGKIGEDVHFLQKPFSMQSLAEKVRETL